MVKAQIILVMLGTMVAVGVLVTENFLVECGLIGSLTLVLATWAWRARVQENAKPPAINHIAMADIPVIDRAVQDNEAA